MTDIRRKLGKQVTIKLLFRDDSSSVANVKWVERKAHIIEEGLLAFHYSRSSKLYTLTHIPTGMIVTRTHYKNPFLHLVFELLPYLDKTGLDSSKAKDIYKNKSFKEFAMILKDFENVYTGQVTAREMKMLPFWKDNADFMARVAKYKGKPLQIADKNGKLHDVPSGMNELAGLLMGDNRFGKI